MDKFKSYYSKYLGIEESIESGGFSLCISSLRDFPTNNKYIYAVIITQVDQKVIVSLSNSGKDHYYSLVQKCIIDQNLDKIIDRLKLYSCELNIRKMQRMIIYKEVNTQVKYLNDLRYNYIDDQYKYIVYCDNVPVGYCKLSNIDYGYGNIVVWTEEHHRRKGIARSLLLLLLNKCRELDIIPVYLVDCTNTASIELAKSVGFNHISTEIIITEEKSG